MKSIRILLVAALVVAATSVRGPAAAPAAASARTPLAPTTSAATAPTYAQLIGQKLVVRMTGTTPTADLLGRIKRGEIGGVILFGSNVTTKTALIALTGKLRA
ncbi:MAG TPA: hypothetical protein VGC90_01265, partial [Candidatus Limnocylindrales bacterium]